MKYLNIDEVKELEKVSSKCSDKYIPIKSTDLIKSLNGFDFKYGCKFRKRSSAHLIKMSKGTDIDLNIENSFDRSLSLRLSFNYYGFIFGRIRQIHKGEPAIELIASQDNINSWYINAIKTIDSLQILKISRSEMIDIATIAFKTRGIKDISEITNIKYDQTNTLDFILHLVNGIKNGDFIRKTTKGLKQIKEVKRESLMLSINYKIWNYLEENNPELYI